MQIGAVIRKYRKEKNITQEEMARRLGVTAPAVNKWENGNSFPDILLLAPIARLLGITVDTLLSFQEELTTEEINSLVRKADERFKKDSYEKTFQWIKGTLEKYPNCYMLIWQMAVMLDAHLMLDGGTESERASNRQKLENDPEETDESGRQSLESGAEEGTGTEKDGKAAKYEAYILECYQRALDSEDENVRIHAADSLFGYYLRNEQYEKAESCLVYFSEQNSEKKRKQAEIYSKTGRREEAYRAYEELLFSGYQNLQLVLTSMYLLAMEEKDWERAHRMEDKLSDLARLFEMGRYYEVSCRLELAIQEKDVDKVLTIMETMLESVDDLGNFQKSSLYEHMTFRKPDEEFRKRMKENLRTCFADEETCGFLKGEERWERLIGKSV